MLTPDRRSQRTRPCTGFDGELLLHDVIAGTSTVRCYGAGRNVGEPVFVPSSADAAEGDGVLLAFVTDVAADRSDLVVLDATTLEDVAAIHLPCRVPVGFHGSWIPAGRAG